MANPEEYVKWRTEEVNMVAIFLCTYGNIKTMPLAGTGCQKKTFNESDREVPYS